MLMFRSMNNDKFMQKYGLEKGFGVKRAMIFDRPPVLTRLFQDLALPIPAAFRDGLGRASRIHKENTTVAAPSSPSGASPAPAPAPSTTPPIASTTPPMPVPPEDRIALATKALREGKNIFGGYGKPINPYGLTSDEQAALIKAPDSPQYLPSPLRGGTRRKRTNGTRRVKKTVEYMAKAFSKVWAKLAKR